jgi:hypothetical protein
VGGTLVGGERVNGGDESEGYMVNGLHIHI